MEQDMPEVTIATLNLFNRVGRWGERAPLVVEQVAEAAPDVIGLQEVDLLIDQGHWLADRLNLWLGPPYYTAYHQNKSGREAAVQAIAVITRLPVLEHEGLDYLSMGRVAQRLLLDLGDGAGLDLYNTHLHYPATVEAERIRCQQARRLLRWMSRHRTLPKVAVGDFNALPDGPTVALMKRRFLSAHEAAHGREPDHTWPSPLLAEPLEPDEAAGTLDYIFVSRGGIRVMEARVAFNRPHADDPALYPSDHFGLLARLAIDRPT
jgi:endonuclease/exonuclease/phosphatase family metal-dependent hydrolase